MKTIKIINGKRGFHLKVNGMFINHSFDHEVKAIKNDIGIPYGATEWMSIKAVRSFWHKYMTLVIHSTTKPYKSVWGNLELIHTKD